MEPVTVRNLEQIQEEDARPRTTRLATLLLASVAGSALVVTFVLMSRGKPDAARATDGPLEALVAQANRDTPATPEKLAQRDVTFPNLLSDQGQPTTALAAVQGEDGRLLKPGPEGSAAAPTAPPVAGDRLPVVPLPAGTLLAATPVTTEPKDDLTVMAASAGQVDPDADPAAAGMEGGYQIQVASFKDVKDADGFVDNLRKRGHRAYHQAAYVTGRGLWHRVRIGPFKTLFEANQYKKKLVQVERLSAFVIDPFKVKQQEELRAARVEIRKRKTQTP
jgi:DedD protein